MDSSSTLPNAVGSAPCRGTGKGVEMVRLLGLELHGGGRDMNVRIWQAWRGTGKGVEMVRLLGLELHGGERDMNVRIWQGSLAFFSSLDPESHYRRP